jgi:hypothetical protein
MSEPSFQEQVSKLGNAVAHHIAGHGAASCRALYGAALPLLHWLDYLGKSEVTGCCDELLNGTRSAIVETCGCVSLGLVRPALFALRGQIDLMLAWMFFKDHPVEWEFVQRTGDGFKLKGEILKFLEDHIENFRTRWTTLTSVKSRKEADPYRLLSAHVHSQTTLAMPVHGHLETLVSNRARCNECVLIQKEISEYLSDVLLSYFASKWASLPDLIITSAKARLGPTKAARVFG